MSRFPDAGSVGRRARLTPHGRQEGVSCCASIPRSGRTSSARAKATCAASTHKSNICSAMPSHAAASSPRKRAAGARRAMATRWTDVLAATSACAIRRSTGARCAPRRTAMRPGCSNCTAPRCASTSTRPGAGTTPWQRAHFAQHYVPARNALIVRDAGTLNADRPHQPVPALAKSLPARHRVDRRRTQRGLGSAVINAVLASLASHADRSSCWCSTATPHGVSTHGWGLRSSRMTAQGCACARSDAALSARSTR